MGPEEKNRRVLYNTLGDSRILLCNGRREKFLKDEELDLRPEICPSMYQNRFLESCILNCRVLRVYSKLSHVDRKTSAVLFCLIADMKHYSLYSPCTPSKLEPLMINTSRPSSQVLSFHSPLSVAVTSRALRPFHSPLPHHLLLSFYARFADCVRLGSR